MQYFVLPAETIFFPALKCPIPSCICGIIRVSAGKGVVCQVRLTFIKRGELCLQLGPSISYVIRGHNANDAVITDYR